MIIQKFLIPLPTEHRTNLAAAVAKLQDGQWDTQPHRLKIHRQCPDIFLLNGRPAWLVNGDSPSLCVFEQDRIVSRKLLYNARLKNDVTRSLIAKISDGIYFGCQRTFIPGAPVYHPFLLKIGENDATMVFGSTKDKLPRSPETVRLSSCRSKLYVGCEVDAGAIYHIDEFIPVKQLYEFNINQLSLRYIPGSEVANTELAKNSTSTLDFIALNQSDVVFDGKGHLFGCRFLTFTPDKLDNQLECEQIPLKFPVIPQATQLNSGYYRYGDFVCGKICKKEALVLDVCDGKNYRIHHCTFNDV